MNILVLGGAGQLASALKALPTDNSNNFIFLDRSQLNVCDSVDINLPLIKNLKPHAIINTAAYTQVDKAESEANKAFAINSEALKGLSLISNQCQAKLIHISTDFVFDGKKNTPYLENDLCNPISIYGKSKRQGEEQIIETCHDYAIFRTSWLYSAKHPSFYTTMIRLAKDRKQLSVVYDQVGTPTSAHSLAQALVHYLQNSRTTQQELYHFSNEGVCSWYDFATSIFRHRGLNIDVIPILTSEYPTPANRPQYSVLSKRKFSQEWNYRIPHWEQALNEVIISSPSAG